MSLSSGSDRCGFNLRLAIELNERLKSLEELGIDPRRIFTQDLSPLIRDPDEASELGLSISPAFFR